MTHRIMWRRVLSEVTNQGKVFITNTIIWCNLKKIKKKPRTYPLNVQNKTHKKQCGGNRKCQVRAIVLSINKAIVVPLIQWVLYRLILVVQKLFVNNIKFHKRFSSSLFCLIFRLFIPFKVTLGEICPYGDIGGIN